LYKKVYRLSEKNHENKLIHQLTAKVLKGLQRVFFWFPIVFITQQVVPNIIPLNQFVEFYGINFLHGIYSSNNVIYVVTSYVLYLLALLYSNTNKTLEYDEKMSRVFHDFTHYYRDYVYRITIYLRKVGVKSPEFDKAHRIYIVDRLQTLIRGLCDEMRLSLSVLLNDGNCYLSLKLLRDTGKDRSGHQKLELFDYITSPDGAKKAPTGIVELTNAEVSKPESYFQLLLNNYHTMKNQGSVILSKLVFKCNDIKGANVFEPSLKAFPDKNARSVIIAPLTVNKEIKGFLCFCSNKAGKLRDKHKQFVCGLSDIIGCNFQDYFK